MTPFQHAQCFGLSQLSLKNKTILGKINLTLFFLFLLLWFEDIYISLDYSINVLLIFKIQFYITKGLTHQNIAGDL